MCTYDYNKRTQVYSIQAIKGRVRKEETILGLLTIQKNKNIVRLFEVYDPTLHIIAIRDKSETLLSKKKIKKKNTRGE